MIDISGFLRKGEKLSDEGDPGELMIVLRVNASDWHETIKEDIESLGVDTLAEYRILK